MWQGQRVERGQLVTSRNALSVATGIPEQSIRTALKRITQTGEIAVKSTSRFTIITVHQYDTYQIQHNRSTSGSTSGSTSDQPADQPQTTSKQSKQVNKLPLVRFDYENRNLTGLTDQDFLKWSEAFPAVNIRQEVKSAEQWLADNPKKRKQQVRRFLTNWLRRTQEKGGNNQGQPTDSISDTYAKLQAEGKIPG